MIIGVVIGLLMAMVFYLSAVLASNRSQRPKKGKQEKTDKKKEKPDDDAPF